MHYLKRLGILFGICGSLFNLGCSSWELKNKCENTNWFEYSQNLAFNGKYLEEDAFVKDCKEVDRSHAEQLDLGFKLGREKMCQYSEIFERAKAGVPVFFKFCEGLDSVKMRQKYSDGLEIFCTPDIGYKFGRSGKIYQNLCPHDKEVTFYPFYFKGRREFLVEEISRREKIIDGLFVERSSLELREAEISREYVSIPSNLLNCSAKSIYNEASKKEENKQVCEEPHYIQSQRQSFYSSLEDVRSNLRQINGQIYDLRSKIDNDRKEIAKIPN